jgi:hypothetical protein
MAANLSTHLIIQAYQTRSGNTDRTQVIPEANGQTFLQGNPLTLVNGYVTAWTTPVPSGTPPGNTTGLVGFAKQNGQNLSGTVGASAPAQPFGSVPQPGTAYTFGTPFSDGRTIFTEANADTIFIGQFDNNTGSNYTPTQAMLGESFGLTADANNYYYVDGGKTSIGTSTVVVIVGFDPISGAGVPNGNVLFQVLLGQEQFLHV